MFDLFNFFFGLNDFSFFVFGVSILLLDVVLSKILEENKVNFGVSINDTQVIIEELSLLTSNVTTRKKCFVSVACLLLLQL